MSDSIQAAAQQKYLNKRWAELLETRQESNLTGDEIAAEVIQRCGLHLKGGE